MNRPIGIFDSGIGGLAVARAIKDQLPQEQIIYFGDTARMPYGTKSSATIQAYAQQVCDFLLQKHCKLILIACNSASSAAYEHLKQQVDQQAILMSVIDPMVAHIVRHFSGQAIGLIGTQQTVSSGVYLKKIHALDPTIACRAVSTPQLIAMIEAGLAQRSAMQAVLQRDLKDPALQHIQTLVLGCTHYSFIRKDIQKFYGEQVVTLDPAALAANALHQLLQDQQLLSNQDRPRDYFFASKLTPNFEAVVQKLFNLSVCLAQLPT